MIINLSFSTGIYPDNLKIAKVNPIYKDKGSMLQCCNYRPISLLSNINIAILLPSAFDNFICGRASTSFRVFVNVVLVSLHSFSVNMVDDKSSHLFSEYERQ